MPMTVQALRTDTVLDMESLQQFASHRGYGTHELSYKPRPNLRRPRLGRSRGCISSILQGCIVLCTATTSPIRS